MIAGDTFQLALRNLRQSRLRSALTALGVAIGIGSLVCMVSLGIGLQEQVLGQFLKSGLFDMITVFSAQSDPTRAMRARMPRRPAARMQNAAKPAASENPPPVLDDAALQSLAKLERVKEVYPNFRVPVELRYADTSEFTTVAGVPMSARGEGVFQHIVHGGFFPNETEDSCLISLDLARRLVESDAAGLLGKELTVAYAAAPGAAANAAPQPAGPGGISLQRSEKRFRIVGIIEREAGPAAGALFAAVMIPVGKAREIATYDLSSPQAFLRQLADRKSYSSVIVKVQRPQDTESVEAKIKELGYSAFSINDSLKGVQRGFLLLNMLLGVTGSIALSVASLGIVNTMITSILERTREIGIMKAIGGSDGDVRRIFLVEAACIGLMGGLLGIFLGWSVGRLINLGANWYIESQGGTAGNLFTLPWWLFAGALAFSVLVSLVAGSYPAGRAARLDPIQALRHD